MLGLVTPLRSIGQERTRTSLTLQWPAGVLYFVLVLRLARAGFRPSPLHLDLTRSVSQACQCSRGREPDGCDCLQGVLSPECAALVALGDPKDVYAAYESALGTSLLASQLKAFESGIGLPVRPASPFDPRHMCV